MVLQIKFLNSHPAGGTVWSQCLRSLLWRALAFPKALLLEEPEDLLSRAETQKTRLCTSNH